MILLGIPLAILVVWLAAAALAALRLGLDFRQALLYAPLKLLWRISDGQARITRESPGPVIYVVVHQSRLDPALMLSLLPDQTLHILDPHSAKAMWLEPYRELARTIAFNAEHVFVSRRLVRHLRGKGRLAVYIPDAVEPDAKAFRLYRAVARIAVAAEARIIPIIVDGARDFSLSLTEPGESRRRWLPKLAITALEPFTIAALSARSAEPSPSANALFDRIAEARLAAAGLDRSLFKALRRAGRHIGLDRVAVEDETTALSHRQLFRDARLLGLHLAARSAPGEAVGVLLPGSAAFATAFVGLLSAGRVAAMIDRAAGPVAVSAAVRDAMIRTVLASRAFVADAGLADIVAAAEAGGARFLWLEDIQAGPLERLFARLQWRQPVARTDGNSPAIMLLEHGRTPVVLSHRNVHANAMQIAARLGFSRKDASSSLLPPAHPNALTMGLVLPLLVGAKALLSRTGGASVLIGTDAALEQVAGAAASARLVIALTRRVEIGRAGRDWRSGHALTGVRIVDGFSLAGAGAIIALNTTIQNREGSVGRLLPAIRARIDPVEGLSDGGRLRISGPSLGGYLADRHGATPRPVDSWHDTGLIVAFDREGFLFVRGRAERIASVGGDIVSLDAIEALAGTLWPEGRHAAVAVPDRRKGERVVLVTTAAAAKPLELKRGSKARGSPAAGDIMLVDEIPVSDTGQTDYEAIRRLAADRPSRKKAA